MKKKLAIYKKKNYILQNPRHLHLLKQILISKYLCPVTEYNTNNVYVNMLETQLSRDLCMSLETTQSESGVLIYRQESCITTLFT